MNLTNLKSARSAHSVRSNEESDYLANSTLTTTTTRLVGRKCFLYSDRERSEAMSTVATVALDGECTQYHLSHAQFSQHSRVCTHAHMIYDHARMHAAFAKRILLSSILPCHPATRLPCFSRTATSHHDYLPHLGHLPQRTLHGRVVRRFTLRTLLRRNSGRSAVLPNPLSSQNVAETNFL